LDTFGITILIKVTTSILFLLSVAILLYNFEKIDYLNQLLGNEMEFHKKNNKEHVNKK